MAANAMTAADEMKKPNRRSSAMRRCPKCNRFLRIETRNEVSLGKCPTCDGAWFDRQALDKVWARMRQVQMEWEKDHNPARPRPGLYDLDHVDSQCPSLSKAERERRLAELLRIFE